MSQQLLAFAPRRCVELGILDTGRVVTAPATTLFVDLAGFTSLTDRLGAFGAQGAEELSALLHGFFGPAADIVMATGGDAVAFGGDALTVVYDGPADLALQAALDSAERITALARRTAGTMSSAGAVSLRTRIGIARGTVTTAVAASPGRLLPVHLGPALDRAVEAQVSARPGEIVVASSARVGPPPSGTSGAAAEAPRGGPDTHDATLERLVHPVVLDRLSVGQGLLERHRMVTVAFVRFPASATADPEAFVSSVGGFLQLAEAYDAEVVQVSGGDKGVVAMTVLGAPVAHTDDPRRAAQLVLDLRRQEPSLAAGIATGPVFTALIGSTSRRFPAHFGSTVNLAARLTQAAEPSQVLLAPGTWAETRRWLRTERTPVGVGGRFSADARTVVGLRHRPRRPATRADLPLVGRRDAVGACERLLDDLDRGRGRLFRVAGDPGIGVSRLLREAAMLGAARGFTTVHLDAADYPRGRPAGLWRDLLDGSTAGAARAGGTPWEDWLQTLLPDVGDELAALHGLLGLAPRPQTEGMDAGLVPELAEGLFARAVARARPRQRLLLVVDHVHRLDQASVKALVAVGRALEDTSVALVLGLRRGTTDEDPARAEELLELTPLDATEVEVLAADAWRGAGGGHPPAWLRPQVARRSGGNPLLAWAVARGLRATWEPGQPPPTDESSDPSLRALLTEQVDRLPASCQQVLGVLAVVRSPCTEKLAAEVLGGSAQHIDEGLRGLLAHQLVSVEPVSQTYRIANDTVRSVVYRALSLSERVRLHRRMVRLLTAATPDPVEVAEHVVPLGDEELARRWFPDAAASARASGDVPGAVAWWRRALPLLEGAARDRGQVELAEVLLVAGSPEQVLAREGGSVSEALPEDEALAVARLGSDLARRWLLTLAVAAFRCGDLDRSTADAEVLLRLARGVDEPVRQRAGELWVLAACERGDLGAARSAAHLHLAEARRSGDARAIVTAEAALGAVQLLCGRPDRAEPHYRAALAGAETLGDAVVEVHVLSDLAGCAYMGGRHAECAELMSRARRSAETIGYRRHLAFSLSNEAQLRAGLGDPYAGSCAAAAVRRSLELGDPPTASNALDGWLRSDVALAADATLWRRLCRIEEALGRKTALADALACLAVAAARERRGPEAVDAAERALALAGDDEQAPVRRRARLALLLARKDTGGRWGSGADRWFVAGLEELATGEDVTEVERAEILLERWRATAAEQDHADAVAACRDAFAAEPSALVRGWFAELSETPPPPPGPLPPPEGIGTVLTTREALDAAMTEVERAVGARHPVRR